MNDDDDNNNNNYNVQRRVQIIKLIVMQMYRRP